MILNMFSLCYINCDFSNKLCFIFWSVRLCLWYTQTCYTMCWFEIKIISCEDEIHLFFHECSTYFYVCWLYDKFMYFIVRIRFCTHWKFNKICKSWTRYNRQSCLDKQMQCEFHLCFGLSVPILVPAVCPGTSDTIAFLSPSLSFLTSVSWY